jgi:hypothetical protein
LAVLAAVASMAAAEDGVALAFKFEPGDTAKYDVSLSGGGGIQSPDGKMIAALLHGDMRVFYRVVDVLPDGSGRLDVQIERANLQVSIDQENARFSYQDGRLRWYANGKEQVPPDTDPQQVPLFGTPLNVTMAPNGRLIDVVLPQIDGMPAMQHAVPGLQMPDFRNTGEPAFPDEPVSVGQTWRRTTQLQPLGPQMPITVRTSRTLASYTDEGGVGVATITGQGDVIIRPQPMTVSAGESPTTVSLPEVRQTLTSTEFFDATQGRLMRADYRVVISTQGPLEVAGQRQDVGIQAQLTANIQAR